MIKAFLKYRSEFQKSYYIFLVVEKIPHKFYFLFLNLNLINDLHDIINWTIEV